MVQNVIDKTTNSGTSSWDRQVYFNDAIGYWPWAQDISGSFDEFSAAVVPLPSGVLMGLAGLGIVAIRRRRHRPGRSPDHDDRRRPRPPAGAGVRFGR